MIKIQYKDELGLVEATFDSFESFNNYKESLLKSISDKKNEEDRLRSEKERKEAECIEANWNTLRREAKNLVGKAKSYGVSPSGVLELIKTAIYDAADDRCLAHPIKGESDRDLITLLRGSLAEKEHEPTDYCRCGRSAAEPENCD